MTGFARAALMRRLGDLITRERRAAGPPGGQRLRQALPRDDRPAATGSAAGTTTTPGSPTRSRAGRSRRRTRTTSSTPAASRSAWSRAITPWNSPLLLMTLEARARRWRRAARSWSSRRSTRPASTLGVRRADRRGRVPARRGQRRHRALPRDRRGAGGAPGRRQGRVHRLDGHRPRGGARGRGEPQQGHAGAGRQVPAGRVPGRRPAGRGQRPRRRRVRGHRADLHGRARG